MCFFVSAVSLVIAVFTFIFAISYLLGSVCTQRWLGLIGTFLFGLLCLSAVFVLIHSFKFFRQSLLKAIPQLGQLCVEPSAKEIELLDHLLNNLFSSTPKVGGVLVLTLFAVGMAWQHLFH